MGLLPLDGPFAEVNREAVLLLGGPRALLMQLAHPLVAAGVADHSDFRRDPLGRLRRTLDAMFSMIFDDEATARASAARVAAVHRRVQGTLAEATAHFPAGTPYDARDPELALWVHATLVDSALVTYECLVAPLEPVVRARFYEESRVIASLFDLPEGLVPAGLEDFETYVAEMLAGPCLEITPAGAELADAVLHPPLPGLPRAAGDAAGVLTVGLLPPTLRDRYGFPWGSRRETAFRATRSVVRNTLPLLPGFARTFPRARRALRTRTNTASEG